jgi:hypothetical protein
VKVGRAGGARGPGGVRQARVIMTEEPGNKYGSFYGNPDGVAPGLPPPKGGPEGHPCATLFAAKDDSDAGSGGKARKLVVTVVVLLLLGGGAAAFVALGGKSMLMPRGARASESAEQVLAIDQTKSLVQTLRSQLDRYRAQHDGQSPSLGRLQDDWEVMLRKTFRDGTLVPDGPPTKSFRRLGDPLGPYLKGVPVNPLTGSASVVAVGLATPGAGWTYDELSGRLWAVAPVNSERVRLAGECFEVVKPGQ